MLQEQQVIFYAIIVGIVSLVIYLTSKGSRQSQIEELVDVIVNVLPSEQDSDTPLTLEKVEKTINVPTSTNLSRGSGEKTKPKKTTKPKVSKPKKETPKKTTLLEPIVKRKKKNK